MVFAFILLAFCKGGHPMQRRLLAVMPLSANYLPTYDVEVAHSFEEAKEMIQSAEMLGTPYADLDLPVGDEKRFWQFIDWMEKTHRKYSFSIFGVKNSKQFITIVQKARKRGFHINT